VTRKKRSAKNPTPYELYRRLGYSSSEAIRASRLDKRAAKLRDQLIECFKKQLRGQP
jgi:hypothetical protein